MAASEADERYALSIVRDDLSLFAPDASSPDMNEDRRSAIASSGAHLTKQKFDIHTPSVTHRPGGPTHEVAESDNWRPAVYLAT